MIEDLDPETLDAMVKKAEDRSFMMWLDSIDISKWDYLFDDNKFVFDKCLKLYQFDHPDVDYHGFKEVMERFCEQNNIGIIYSKNKGKNGCSRKQSHDWVHNYRRE